MSGAGPVRADLGDGWSIAVPPGMEVGRDEEDGAVVAWDEGRTLRMSTLTTGGLEDGTSVGPRQMLGDPPGELEERPGGILLRVEAPETVVEDGRTLLTLTARAAAPNRLLLMSFFTAGDDLAWAEETLRTVDYQPW